MHGGFYERRSQNLSSERLEKKLDQFLGAWENAVVGSLYVSASEIESFDLCQRKWAFTYIEGKRLPPNESAALGTRVHTILEKWLRDGTAPDLLTDEGAIAASGLHLLPPPRLPGLVTEERFHFTSQRAWYTGFKDFRYRDANGLLHVGDHKTTKAFNWAKSLEEILCHAQSLIYAVDEFHKNPNDDRIALDWIYYKTKGSRKAEPRFQIVTKETVAEMFFEHVDPVAGQITLLHNSTPPGASALDFAPDFRSCDAFGGCAFLSICNPTPTQRVQANMTQTALTLGEKLKAMKDKRAPSPIHPPEHTQVAPPQAAPMMGDLPGTSPYPGFAMPPNHGAPPAPSPQFALPFPTPDPTTGPNNPHAPQPQAYVPPPQAAPMTFPSPAPVDQTQTMAAHFAPGGPGYVPPPVVQAVPIEAAIAQSQAAPVAPGTVAGFTVTPTETAPKKRGRPKVATSAVAEQKVSEKNGFTLYVGCAPIGCQVTNALEYVTAAHERFQAASGISHYREIDFGKGPGELCKSLELLLAECEVADAAPSGDVVLGSTQIEEDTAAVWFARAAKVVRAFR